MTAGVDSAGRRRVQHRFDLNLNKEDEYELHEIIRLLKRKRSFLGVIRDGIRLILDLRRGQTDVLCELFPWVFEQTVVVPEETISKDLFRSHFQELKVLISQQAMPPASSGPQPAAASFKMNLEEVGEELVVKEQAISEDYNPTWTFAIRSATIAAGNYASLTPEMIWYGIRNGMIDVESAVEDGVLNYEQIADGVRAGKVRKEKLPKAIAQQVEKSRGKGGPKKIAGADIALSVPNFDDIAIDF